MHTIRIVITDGRATCVEISENKKTRNQKQKKELKSLSVQWQKKSCTIPINERCGKGMGSGTKEGVLPVVTMRIKANPYDHQIRAFNFACSLLGLVGGDDDNISINRVTNAVALLMEM